MKNKICYANLYILITTFIFISANCFSQDTIVKCDGQQLLGKVIEVSLTEVKYKKGELPEGPLYIEDKATIARIKYQNGYIDLFPETINPTNHPTESQKETYNNYKQVDEKYPSLVKTGSTYIYNNDVINERQMQDILLAIKDPAITTQIRNARLLKRLRLVGLLALPLAAATVITSANHLTFNEGISTDNNAVYGLALATGFTIGTSIYFEEDHKRRNARAVRLYRENYMMKK